MIQLPIKKIEEISSPFENDVWDCGIVSKEMVLHAFKNELALDHVQWATLHLPTTERGLTATLDGITVQDHAARIAFLMREGWSDPVEVDVGVPSQNYFPVWMWTDGNHRIAAAIMLAHETISAEIAGDLDYAEEIFGITIPDGEEASYEEVQQA